MTLSTAGKDWLAINAGVNNCFSPTGVSFVDADGVPFTAGTKDVVITFIGAHMGLKDDAIIIANTSYNGFKAINGADLAFPDVTWVYNSDGHVGATLPLYCGPANIISTDLSVSTNLCTEPCNVTGSVSWTNTGGSTGTFDPTILFNTVPFSLGPTETIDPGQIITHGFSLPPDLITGIYVVQASPNTGTTPQTITVTTPSNVISATLTVDTNLCTEPCTVNGTVSWTNTGGTASVPTDLSITVNGTPTPIASAVTINPGETLSYTFSIPDLIAGIYAVQASPNAGTAPQIITVTTPANIIATAITPSTTTCTTPCDMTVDVTWINNGGVPGTFEPTITVDGTPTALSTESLESGQSITRTFSLTGLTVGDHIICAVPNTFPCVTVSVTVPTTSVNITSTPIIGATIYIDDIIKPEVTPATITGLTEGLHTYRLTHVDCDNEATGQFTTIIGTVVNVTATFDTSARFESAPSGARIWIDGVDKGIDTPGTITGLIPGSHTYKLTLATYADLTGSFTVDICKRKNITASISKFREAGLGFMIAGLAVGALLLGKKKKKEPEKEKLTY